MEDKKTKPMTEREKLSKQLADLETFIGDVEEVADFILSDRKRIVEPLVNLELKNAGSSYEFLCQGIEQTLKLAGYKDD